MLQSYSTCPEDRAMLRSNPSAEAGTKTEEGGSCCPLFIPFGIGIKAINLRGLGTESPGIPNYPHKIAKKPQYRKNQLILQHKLPGSQKPEEPV